MDILVLVVFFFEVCKKNYSSFGL